MGARLALDGMVRRGHSVLHGHDLEGPAVIPLQVEKSAFRRADMDPEPKAALAAGPLVARSVEFLRPCASRCGESLVPLFDDEQMGAAWPNPRLDRPAGLNLRGPQTHQVREAGIAESRGSETSNRRFRRVREAGSQIAARVVLWRA